MDKIVEQLDAKLQEWQPELAEEMRRQIADLINLADRDGLDALRLKQQVRQAKMLGWSETVAAWTGSPDVPRFEAMREELSPPNEPMLG